MFDFPTVQLSIKPGVLDLTWGQPDPALLPVDEMKRATQRALERYGPDALAYGADAGAGPLLAYLRARIERSEGRRLAEDDIMITAGNSDALDQICTHLTQPGDTVLVEAFTYHLAVRILRDHHLNIVPVAMDEEGLRVNALQKTLSELRHAGRTPRFLYIIPTFHNPTGANLSEARRRGLVKVAAAEHLLIVEDDVYRELGYDNGSPPSLWSLAQDGVVLRMGSFSKSLAPGLRLGWLTGSADHIRRLKGSGLRDSGGGVNHFAAMATAELCEAGDYDRQIARLVETYRERRDAMSNALREFVPAGRFVKPGGGFFIWLRLPEGLDSVALRSRAEEAGVSYIPGTRFSQDGSGADALRVAFSLYPPADLVTAARRLGEVIR